MTTSNARIESLEDARTMVRHYMTLGTKVIEQYMHPHRRLRHVMKDGELFEADTLTKVWPERPPPPRLRYRRDHGPPEEIGGEPVEEPADPLSGNGGGH